MREKRLRNKVNKVKNHETYYLFCEMIDRPTDQVTYIMDAL